MANTQNLVNTADAVEENANTSQNGQSSDSQPICATVSVKRVRRSNKPPAVKAAVLVQRANGTYKAKIARDLGITRPTVDAIIAEADLDRQMESGQLLSVQLIPEAIRVAKHRLSQNSENMAIKVLENTVWPLNQKSGKGPGDQGLVLAIQNLMGNVQIAAQPTDSKAVEPIKTVQVEPSTGTIALPDNCATVPQVVENKGNVG